LYSKIKFIIRKNKEDPKITKMNSFEDAGTKRENKNKNISQKALNIPAPKRTSIRFVVR
jgi:hypothetical protein